MRIVDFFRTGARRISLKTKVALAFVAIMGMLLLRISSYNQYYMVEVQGKEKVTNQLKIAHTYFYNQVEQFCLRFETIAQETDHNEMNSRNFQRWFAQTREWKKAFLPDMFFYIDTSGNIIYSGNHKYTPEERAETRKQFLSLPSVRLALTGQRVRGFEIIPPELLIKEGLYEKARVAVVSGSNTGKSLAPVDRAIAVATAAPIYNNGKLAGALVAQKILNNDISLTGTLKEAFGSEVTIFLNNIRVSTTITDKNGKTGTGTVLADQEQDQAPSKAGNHSGSTYIIDDWYITADEPLKDLNNRIIGTFQVGIKESNLTEKSKTMNNEISGTLIIISILFTILFVWLYRSVIIPIGTISSRVLEVSRGKLDVRIPTPNRESCWEFTKCDEKSCSLYGREHMKCWLVSGKSCCGLYSDDEKKDKCKKCRYYKAFSGDEIQHLIDAFNFMAASVQEQTLSLKILNLELETKNSELTDQRDEVEAQRQELLALNEELEESMKALDDSQSIIYALAVAVEAKDPYTRGHSERVADYCLDLGRALGLSLHELDIINGAALLHDIGKIGISERILKKPAALSAAEFQHVKKHPGIGERICSSLKFAREMLPIIRHHHEHFDGRGYPDGLKNEAIPYLARIVAIADAFDAMTSDRPYRNGMSPYQAIEILKAGAGTQWDPKMVDKFVELIQKELEENNGILSRNTGGEEEILNEKG